ncbi:MAG TPA: outer membrane beta-barrel protein [Longimicrobium sp.]|nr:outer membrane beta-barrel protein [Longimicrobium sp.]
MRLHTLAALLVLSALSSHAQAQSRRYSFFSAGPGGAPDERYLDPQYTLMAGYGTTFGAAGGAHVSLRTIIAYARFRPDERALLDSLSTPGGRVEGGKSTVLDTGGDLVAGVNAGLVGAYAFYGLHYYWESHEAPTEGGEDLPRRRFRSDLGPSYGGGVRLNFSRDAALFGEWYRGGGSDDRMIRQQGLRFGLTGSF